MKLSLILTTYNSAENLKRTLDSIMMQDYPDIEICIKDGGSTDGTIEIIKEYAKKSQYPVKWESSSDNGIYDAMNRGYALSSGDVIAFFNDLFLAKDVVSKMMRLIDNEAADYSVGTEAVHIAGVEADKKLRIVGAHADLIYATDEKVVRYWKMGKQRSLYSGWMPGHPTLFLKREVYDKYGIYDTSYRIAADYEFMIRFLKDKGNYLAYLPETIIRMFYGGTSNATAGSYMESLKEGHRALKQNGIRFAWIVDCLRTIRVLLQFVIGTK